MGNYENIKAAIEWLKKQGYEKIQAHILMFSTEADTIWLSKESCENDGGSKINEGQQTQI